ncbi:MAG: hypothetical protein EBQ92_12880, partial [Proteobacteria bacterium]|nr:hypothetical protein [Pseudomonadota bacterium]
FGFLNESGKKTKEYIIEKKISSTISDIYCKLIDYYYGDGTTLLNSYECKRDNCFVLIKNGYLFWIYKVLNEESINIIKNNWVPEIRIPEKQGEEVEGEQTFINNKPLRIFTGYYKNISAIICPSIPKYTRAIMFNRLGIDAKPKQVEYEAVKYFYKKYHKQHPKILFFVQTLTKEDVDEHLRKYIFECTMFDNENIIAQSKLANSYANWRAVNDKWLGPQKTLIKHFIASGFSKPLPFRKIVEQGDESVSVEQGNELPSFSEIITQIKDAMIIRTFVETLFKLAIPYCIAGSFDNPEEKIINFIRGEKNYIVSYHTASESLAKGDIVIDDELLVSNFKILFRDSELFDEYNKMVDQVGRLFHGVATSFKTSVAYIDYMTNKIGYQSEEKLTDNLSYYGKNSYLRYLRPIDFLSGELKDNIDCLLIQSLIIRTYDKDAKRTSNPNPLLAESNNILHRLKVTSEEEILRIVNLISPKLVELYRGLSESYPTLYNEILNLRIGSSSMLLGVDEFIKSISICDEEVKITKYGEYWGFFVKNIKLLIEKIEGYISQDELNISEEEMDKDFFWIIDRETTGIKFSKIVITTICSRVTEDEESLWLSGWGFQGVEKFEVNILLMGQTNDVEFSKVMVGGDEGIDITDDVVYGIGLVGEGLVKICEG